MAKGITSRRTECQRGKEGQFFREGFPNNCKNGDITNDLGEVFVPQEGEYIVKAFDPNKRVFNAQYSVTNLGNVFSHKGGKDEGKPTTRWLRPVEDKRGYYTVAYGWRVNRLVIFSCFADALLRGYFDALDPDLYFDLSREDIVTDDYEEGKAGTVKRLRKLKGITKLKTPEGKALYDANHRNGNIADNSLGNLQLLLRQNNKSLAAKIDLSKKESRRRLREVAGEKPAIICRNNVEYYNKPIHLVGGEVTMGSPKELESFIKKLDKEEEEYIREYKEKHRKDA